MATNICCLRSKSILNGSEFQLFFLYLEQAVHLHWFHDPLFDPTFAVSPNHIAVSLHLHPLYWSGHFLFPTGQSWAFLELWSAGLPKACHWWPFGNYSGVFQRWNSNLKIRLPWNIPCKLFRGILQNDPISGMLILELKTWYPNSRYLQSAGCLANGCWISAIRWLPGRYTPSVRYLNFQTFFNCQFLK